MLSELLYEPGVALPDALRQYTRFYACLRPYAESFVVADESRLASALDAGAPGQGRADELWLTLPHGRHALLDSAPYSRFPLTTRAALEAASR